MNNNETGTRSFVFMPSYLDMAKKMNDADRLSFLMALAEYGTTGNLVEVNTIVDVAMTAIIPIIDQGKIDYETSKANGKKGGRPTTTPIDDIRSMKKQGRTQAEIAKILKVSVSTVRKYWDYKDDANGTEYRRDGDEDEDYNINTDEDADKDMGDTGGFKQLITNNNGYQRLEQPTTSQSLSLIEKMRFDELVSSLADILGDQYRNEIIKMIGDKCASHKTSVLDFKDAFDADSSRITNALKEQVNISPSVVRDVINSIAQSARIRKDHRNKTTIMKDDMLTCLGEWEANLR